MKASSQTAPRSQHDDATAIGIKKILVPIDFSEAGKPALNYAKSLAQVTGASIHLVHVMERIYQASPTYVTGELTYVQLDTARMREVITRKIGALQVGVFRGFKTTFEIREGVTHYEIVDAIKPAKADLVVMATHGYTGLRHVLLGSTTERVIRHAPCPVLVVRSSFSVARKKTPHRKRPRVSVKR